MRTKIVLVGLFVLVVLGNTVKMVSNQGGRATLVAGLAGLAIGLPIALVFVRRLTSRAALQPGDVWRGTAASGPRVGTMILRPTELRWEAFDPWRREVVPGGWAIGLDELASVDVGPVRGGRIRTVRARVRFNLRDGGTHDLDVADPHGLSAALDGLRSTA